MQRVVLGGAIFLTSCFKKKTVCVSSTFNIAFKLINIFLFISFIPLSKWDFFINNFHAQLYILFNMRNVYKKTNYLYNKK